METPKVSMEGPSKKSNTSPAPATPGARLRAVYCCSRRRAGKPVAAAIAPSTASEALVVAMTGCTTRRTAGGMRDALEPVGE